MEKKSLIVIIGLLVVAFGVYAYLYPPTANNGTAEGQSTLASSKFADLKDSEPLHPSKLSTSLVREMIDNYRQTQLKSIGGAVSNDASSILFDLDTLKKFINDIERGVKQNQPSVENKLGIRIYYAAYPLKSKWGQAGYKHLKGLLGDQITQLYERKHTLIMLPAIRNAKGIYADFNPIDLKTYSGFKKKLNNVQGLMRQSSDTTEILALNHGQLIPPASNEGEGF